LDHSENSIVAHFLAETTHADTAYISHGEIQLGLSIDGKRWSEELELRLLNDIAAFGQERSIACVKDDDGALVAISIAHWQTGAENPYAVIEDLAVRKDNRQSGVGQSLVSFIEEEAKRRGCRWVFLESGITNYTAHRFFENRGYLAVSHVFGKLLSESEAP
jgi:GNAT superfamily N-acetyltransferase